MDRMTSLYKLDIFTKIDASFTRTTSVGGTVSLLTYIIITLLMFGEIVDFRNSDIAFRYSVDTDFDKKLDINVDITVATPCSNIGADIMDSTNKHSLYTYGSLNEMDTSFKLNSEQQSKWDRFRSYSNFLREEHHNINQLIWKSSTLEMPIFSDESFHPGQVRGKNQDSCRFHGTLTVNKVAGNFHISAGKYIPLPIGHAHVSLLGNDNAVNYSHRIERLSFGDKTQIVSTLDGVEKTTQSASQVYQYYLKVVLTDVETSTYRTELYQYSVTERDLVVNHNAGAHGIPGIYFKYEIEGLRVNVREDYIPFWKFIVRLCSIVGGVLAISGLINQIATAICDVVTGKYIRNISIN